MPFDFTTPKDPVIGHASKWEAMAALLGHEAPADAIPMWVAQMDFLPGPFLTEAMARIVAGGEYGYFAHVGALYEAAAGWSRDRHGWAADPAHMSVTHGLGNGIGLTLQALTEPDDGIVVFGPVYHEFYHKIRNNGRRVVEHPLAIDGDGLFRMDLDALEAALDGTERAVLISSPHNPAGRVWEAEELRALGRLCARHDLLLISDEIHQDLVYPGHRFVPTAVAAPEVLDRLVVMTAASKTFDIAGLRTGIVTIPDEGLRARFRKLHKALDIAPNRAGMELTMACYSAEGAAWCDALMQVLDRNRQAFCDGVAAIPGAHAMPMQSTFLAWVDFSGTGLSEEDITARVTGEARLVPTPGVQLGTGGALHRRFNIGTVESRVHAAVGRLQEAFADLQ